MTLKKTDRILTINLQELETSHKLAFIRDMVMLLPNADVGAQVTDEAWSGLDKILSEIGQEVEWLEGAVREKPSDLRKGKKKEAA